MADETKVLEGVDNIVGGYFLDSDKPNSGAHNAAGLAVKVLSEDELKQLSESGEPAPLLPRGDAAEAQARAEQGAATAKRGRR